NAVMSGVATGEFAKRIVGGELIRAENGTLVVRAASAKDNLQPISLTTDAIIASSVRNKLGTQPRLKAGGFEVTSTNGVASIAVFKTLSRAYHLKFASTTVHGANGVEVCSNISCAASLCSSHLRRLRQSSSVIFQCFSGSASRCLKRSSCSSLEMCRYSF